MLSQLVDALAFADAVVTTDEHRDGNRENLCTVNKCFEINSTRPWLRPQPSGQTVEKNLFTKTYVYVLLYHYDKEIIYIRYQRQEQRYALRRKIRYSVSEI
jgi:endonuclease/exonuclease/phosphatase (EEP) superfamily protein YafD